MSKTVIVSIFILSLFFLSCEEDFSPYGKFRENYILTCVLRSDTAYQTATLSRSYFTGTNDPFDNEIDPSIRFADVRVWYEDSVYVLHDSTSTRTDTSRYKTPESFYVTNRFKVTQNKPIEIEVLLQNGRRLKAKSVTPKDILFTNLSDVLIPPVYGNIISIYWSNGNTNGFYLPKLFIRYTKRIGNIKTLHHHELPIRYTFLNGTEHPVYPQPSNQLAIVFSMDVISRALNEIKMLQDDSVKISIHEKLEVKVAVLDENLTRYASSTSKTFDDLTVRVNETDYTNINGGLGIFGSFLVKEFDRLRFQENYIKSFGLTFLKDN